MVRAEHGDQERQITSGQLDVGDECVTEHAAPLVGDEDRHDEIGQKRRRRAP